MTINVSVASPADVVNLSLRRIGYKPRVASLFDGTDAARAAPDVYAQTRDEVLRVEDWPFALRQANGVSASETVSGWLYA